MRFIDFRSDTVTKPTPEMRQAMYDAPVGDDVFGEDPTVNQLQEKIAEMFKKEAALFVPSGTMGNQIAINCHTIPGDEIICESTSHCFNYEGGGPALLSGVQVYPIQGENGIITAEQVENVIRPKNDHFPQTRLIVLENTHNSGGGSIFPLDEIIHIGKIARQNDLFMHLDGARLWNAHVATQIPLHEYAHHFDSLSVCLSKGLGAPVGSVVIGSKDFIRRVHRYRKIYGGGMRQAGILAAAGIFALENNLQRLADDHKRAMKLATCLNSFTGIKVNLGVTKTNIVIAEFDQSGYDVAQVVQRFRENGILAIAFSRTKIRFVTHLEIDDKDIERTMQVFSDIFSKS